MVARRGSAKPVTVAPANTAAPASSTGTPLTVAQQVAALLTNASAEERAEARKEISTISKDAKAETKGHVAEVMADDKDAMLLLMNIALGTAPGVTAKGERYLFQTDAFTFIWTDGKKYRFGSSYAIEVK